MADPQEEETKNQNEEKVCGAKRLDTPRMEDASPDSSTSTTASREPLTKMTGNSESCSSTPLSAPPPKRRRRNRSVSSSTSTTPSSTTPLSMKPPLTERQQLALAMQLSSPLASPRSHTPQEAPPPSQGTSGKSKLSKRNDRGETMLHCACIRGDMKAVISLVEGGADVHALDNANWTPLHEAANHGHVGIVDFLLDHGADIHAPGLDKTTPLLDAVYCGHYEVVSLLVKSGADPSKPNAYGMTPLQAATEDEDDRMLAILSGHKDPGEACSPKGTPRKSQQFAKHEKRESPKKTLQFARPTESLIVSFPLQKVRSVKTRLKFDHIISEQEEGVKPISEEVKPLKEKEGSICVEEEEEEATVEGRALEPAGADNREEPAAKGSGAPAGKGAGSSERENEASVGPDRSVQLEEGEDDMETGGEGKTDTEEPAACSTEEMADAEEKPSTDEDRGKDTGSHVERHSPLSPPPPAGWSKESKVEDKAAKKEDVPRDLQCTESCDLEVISTAKRDKEVAKGEEEGAEDDSNKPKPKMRSPPPPPLTLSLPPDHTYCGPAVPGRTPPPRPTLSHDSHVITPTSGYSSPLDCLLQAAEGSMYLSSSPLSTATHKGGTVSKSSPKIVSPQKGSPTPKTTTATSPMSFPVSLSFSKYNLPYPRSAPPTPSNSAVDPLFSLATIATSSSPMPSTSSTSRTLKVPSHVTRTTPRQDSTSGRLREKGRDGKFDVQDESSLPPKKRHRSVFRSEVIAQRQQYKPPVLPSECQLDQFITITGSYPSKALLKQPLTDPSSLSPHLPRGLEHLFNLQEQERRRMKVQHLVEQERLQMHLEGELVRAHSKVHGCPHPPTVCQYITERLRGWQSCMAWDHSEPSFKPYQDDRQGTTVEAGDVEEQRRMKLLHSCVVDVWDKAYAVKVGMSRRQKEEALVLHNGQQMSWLVAAKELGTHHLYADQYVLNLHVPKLAGT